MSLTPAPTLAVLIDRIARELAREAEAVRGLHALAESGGGSPAMIRLAQTIDTTPQHLDELSALLAGLASDLPDIALPDRPLASGIRLSALRERLFGAGDAGDPDAGELDMF